MKHYGRLTVLAGALALLLGTANAQSPARDSARDANEAGGSEEYSASLRYRDYLQGADLRASQIVGAPVRNMEGDSLGEIQELVIGANEQMLVVLGVGGFLGVGEKQVAVPYDELRVSADGDTFFVNRSRSALESAPSYTYRERPAQNDARLASQSQPQQSESQQSQQSNTQDRATLAEEDAQDRTAQNRAQSEANRAADRTAADRSAEQATPPASAERRETTIARDRATDAGAAAAGAAAGNLAADDHRASAIIGATVVDNAGQDVGEIDDLVVSSENGEIQAVLSVGGVAGIGAKLVAVPFDDLQIAPAGDSTDSAPRLRIDMSAEQVRDSLPEFNYERQLAQGSATNPRG